MGLDVVFESPYLNRYLRFGWYLDIIMLIIIGDILLMFGSDSVMDMDDWDCTFDYGWSDVVRFFFSIYNTSDSILGHIFVSIEIYKSSWSCMLVPTYEIHTETMTCLLSYYDLPWKPFLSHLVRPTLFRRLDVIMLLLLGDASLICWSDLASDMDG